MRAFILETSRELTKVSEKIKATCLDGMLKLNDMVGQDDDGLIITVSFVAFVRITAEDGTTNDKWVTVGTDGKIYITGSEPYGRNAMEIAKEMAQAPDEEIVLRVFRKVSTNDPNKKYITCCLV